MSETEEVENQGKYPMPEGHDKKPLKVDGSAIEAIILIPKGVPVKYPAPSESKKEEKSDEKTEEDKEKIKQLEEENAQLKEKLSTLMEERRTELVDEIVELKVNKKLTKDPDAEREKFKNHDLETLKVVLSEIKAIKESKVDTPVTEKVELKDEIEAKKEEIRKRLFGE